MTSPALGITKGLTSWKNPQESNVERLMDNAAYSSVHPDDSLLLAGPPRFMNMDQSDTTSWRSLFAIGMAQGFQMGSQKPSQPMQAIGSGRSFFVSGKSQTTWRIGRLFCNGRNLLRVLYHNVVSAANEGSVNLKDLDDSPVATGNTNMYFINLDSELFYVPFGLGVIYKDKVHDLVGAGYLELCMIQSYGVGLNAGQAMIMEDVSGMCDRVKPFLPSELAANTQQQDMRKALDTAIGFSEVNMPFNGADLEDSVNSFI